MFATPDAIQQQIVAKEAKVEILEQQAQEASGDRELLLPLQQQLAALQQQLAALRQKEVLLMQQAAAATSAGESELETVLKLWYNLWRPDRWRTMRQSHTYSDAQLQSKRSQ